MPDPIPADMDGGWKQLIDDELEEFFRFFFPGVHAAIDFGHGCQSRDKELAKIMAGADMGDREVDKLFEVRWRDGGEELVLIHVEVQARGEQDFAQRMYVYNTRIWQRYGRPAVSLALLVDADPQFRPDRFVREKGGCRLTFTFPVVKLLGFKSAGELESDPSPLAVASLAQLGKLSAGSDMEHRLAVKLAMARALYARGYDRERVLKVFRFLDYVLTLPDSLACRFDREVEDIEEVLNMPYVTSIERRARQEGLQQGMQEGLQQGMQEGLQQGIQEGLQQGMQEGLQQGIQEGLQQGIQEGLQQGQQEGMLQGVRDLLRQALEVRFGAPPDSVLSKIEQCRDVAALRALHEQALTVSSIGELTF